MNGIQRCLASLLLLLTLGTPLVLEADRKDTIRNEWMGQTVDDLNKMAHRYVSENRLDSAMMLFVIMGNKYDDAMKEPQKRTAIHGLNNAGALCTFYTSDYITGYRYLRRAYDLARSNGYDDLIPDIELHLASVYSLFDNKCIEATDMLRHCFKTSEKLGKDDIMVLAFLNLYISGYEGDPGEFRAILSDDIPGTVSKIALSRRLYKGLELMQRKEYEKARHEFDRMRGGYTDIMDSLRSESLIAKMKAGSFMRESRPDSALKYYRQMYALASVAGMMPYEIEASDMMSRCYEQLGDKDMHDAMHLRYLEKKDSLLEVNQIARLNSLRQKDEVEDVERRMNEIASEKRLHQVIGAAAILLMVMAVVFMVFLWRKNKKLRSANRFLYEKTQEMMAEKREPSVEEPEEQRENKPVHEKYQKSSLHDEGVEIIEKKIEVVMEETELICNPEFSLDRLAQAVDSNTAYVSRVINERMGVSFSVLLGNCRIKEALRRMNDTGRYGHLTIEAISQGVGFRSRTPFVNSFKRVTGLTPSEYLREAKDRTKNK